MGRPDRRNGFHVRKEQYRISWNRPHGCTGREAEGIWRQLAVLPDQWERIMGGIGRRTVYVVAVFFLWPGPGSKDVYGQIHTGIKAFVCGERYHDECPLLPVHFSGSAVIYTVWRGCLWKCQWCDDPFHRRTAGRTGGAAAGKFVCCSHVQCGFPAEFHVHGIYQRYLWKIYRKGKGGLLKDLHDGIGRLGNPGIYHHHAGLFRYFKIHFSGYRQLYILYKRPYLRYISFSHAYEKGQWQRNGMRCCIWFHNHIAVWNIGRIYLDVEFCLWHGDDLSGRVCIQLPVWRAGRRTGPALYNPRPYGLFEGAGAYRRKRYQPYALCGW